MTKRPKHPRTALDSIEPHLNPVRGQVVTRPDGYHWTTLDGIQEFGPFETFEAARADMDADAADEVDVDAPSEALLEVEREIGISDWIDAETGEPAEGQSPPHLDEH